MAQFKDSPKAKEYVAKKPVMKQLQSFGHKLYPVLTLINTVILIYIILSR